MGNNTLFVPGKLTFVMDGQFGSSGKGKISSFIGETNKGKFTFACNAFSAQAGHWVKLKDGRTFFYQHLNSIAYNHDLYEKMYIGPSACIELPALLREIEENKITPDKLGISPLATLITSPDMDYEKGLKAFDDFGMKGDSTPNHHGTAKFGSTCHGVGSATARKILRRPSVVCMRDIPEVQPFLCDVSAEIMERLNNGESGLCEIAQGFPLSLNYRFFPYCTSRNVTVSQALSDMFLAPKFAGPVVINLRTFPIRINSNKYVGKDGKHITWQDIENGVEHTVFEGNSGSWFPDQEEITWEQLTELSGSKEKIFEITSVTKLPRRVATFSQENLREAIAFNDTGYEPILSVNFANYVDAEMTGVQDQEKLTPKFKKWLLDNFDGLLPNIRYIGTGALTEDTIELA